MTVDIPATPTDDDLRREALPLLEQALQMIDPVNCPGAAYLDLAIAHIKDDLGISDLAAAE